MFEQNFSYVAGCVFNGNSYCFRRSIATFGEHSGNREHAAAEPDFGPQHATTFGNPFRLRFVARWLIATKTMPDDVIYCTIARNSLAIIVDIAPSKRRFTLTFPRWNIQSFESLMASSFAKFRTEEPGAIKWMIPSGSKKIEKLIKNFQVAVAEKNEQSI